MSDWRNYAKPEDGKLGKYDFEPNNLNYYKYYGVDRQQYSLVLDKAKVEGLTIGGVAQDKIPEQIKLGIFKTEAEAKAADFNITELAGQKWSEGGVVYYRNNGQTLNKDFSITVPVRIEYIWGVIEAPVKVLVKSTDTPTPKKYEIRYVTDVFE